MEPQTNTGQYSIVTLTLLGVVMLILSSAIGAILGPVIFPPVAGTQAEPMQVMQSSSAGVVIGSVDELHNLFGSVTKINGNNFTLRIQETTGTIPDRTVLVTSETRITKATQKDQATLNSEIADFNKKVEDAKKKPQLVLQPDMFIYNDTDASAVGIGDNVKVTATENINTKRSFIASEIQIQSEINISIKK